MKRDVIRDQLLRDQMYVRDRLKELIILAMLERWFSELEPAIARDADGNILGSYPPIQ